MFHSLYSDNNEEQYEKNISGLIQPLWKTYEQGCAPRVTITANSDADSASVSALLRPLYSIVYWELYENHE